MDVLCTCQWLTWNQILAKNNQKGQKLISTIKKMYFWSIMIEA